MRKINMSILLGVFVVLFAVSNVFAGNYEVKLIRSKVLNTGEVVLQVRPGVSETYFTGLARLNIAADDPGKNAMYATILTAISLNKEVVAVATNHPSWESPQYIDAVSIIME